jgi:peroxiredoxin
MARKESLQSQLADISAAQRQIRGGRYQEVIDRMIAQLRRVGFVRNALRSGETAPELVLAATDGTKIDLSSWLDHGPVVLIFIRGGWCPYCRATLQALQEARAEVQRHGARICAISLEPQAENRELAQRLGIEFPLLSDPQGKVANLYGVLYRLPPEAIAEYEALGIDLLGRMHATRWVLPLAATYLIDRDAIVRYAFVEADPARRADPEEVIAALRRLSQSEAGG